MKYIGILVFILTFQLPLLSSGVFAENHAANKRDSRGMPQLNLPPGTRAVAIKVRSRDIEWARPNSMVDVIRIDDSGGKKEAKILAKKVRVLSINPPINLGPPSGGTANVTLMVNEAVAKAILELDSEDLIRLTLRSAW